MNLDDYQKAFCREPSLSVRLLAPAGSGKTLSLLFRCLAKSQAAGDDNLRFLVFTFTRAARGELCDRLKRNDQFARIRPFVDVSTLNSWGFRWLRSRMDNPHLITAIKDRYFTMMNMLQPIWQQHERVRNVMTNSRRKYKAARQIMDLIDQLKSMGFRHDSQTDLGSFTAHVQWAARNGMLPHISSMFTQLSDLEIVDMQKEAPVGQAFANFFGFWREAVQSMYVAAVLTLEDQKYWALLGLEQAIADGRFTTGMHRYHHILVDEFQDINALDLALLKMIARQNKTDLTIVGDDDQAIYEWRGATPKFILNPDEMISPGYQTHILEINYRSPRNIVDLSQRLIKHNKNRVNKNVRAAQSGNARIDVLKMPSLEDAVNYVADIVPAMMNDPTVRNIALISRKRSQIIP